MLNGFGPEAEIKALTAKLAAQYNVKVGYNPADLLQASAVEQLVKDTVSQYKTVDILVNNAGALFLSPSRLTKLRYPARRTYWYNYTVLECEILSCATQMSSQ